jgi:hypothetical protein
MAVRDATSIDRPNARGHFDVMGCVPLPGMVGYGATVPRFRGGRYPRRGLMFRNSEVPLPG